MAEHDFRLLHDQISRGETDKQKYMVVSSALKENCFSATQVMNLVKEFDSEPNRFALLKYATPKVYDKGNYRYAEQMLKDEKLKGDFILFIDQKNVSKKQVERQIKLPSSGCKLADTEYKEIVASISRHSFVNIKLNITKSLIADKKCMSIEQIGGLINLFPQEHHKLTLAKYAVKHLEDQSKIDGLPKYMNSPASKAHLTEYINEVKKERKKG